MTEQLPEPVDEDLTHTRAFQPLDPFGTEHYGEQPFVAEADDGFAAQDPPRAGLRERIASFGRVWTALAATAVVVVVGGAGWWATAALASSGPGPQSPAPRVVAPAPGIAAKKSALRTARITISQVTPSSFVGVDLKGRTVTVAYGDDTKFGTKARPLSPDELVAGMTVTVLGEQSGDTVVATAVGRPAPAG